MNLHERINEISKEEEEKLLLTKIKISGRFSIDDSYNWISHCIPDVPPNVHHDDDESENRTDKLYFKSLFVGTYLILTISKGLIIV